VTDLVQRLARVFVDPAGGARARPEAAVATASVTMVLCGRPDALGLACALALAQRAPLALACAWTGGDHPPVPRAATPRARALAAKLRTRGITARPAGRLAVAELPPDGSEAAALARDAMAAARVPAAVALAGPRCEATDCLLFGADRVIVAGTPGPLRDLAAATLPFEAVALDLPLGGPAAWLARAGLLAVPAVRRALTSPHAA
jgi:hypothetical protein